jgi:hypothetical protein
MPIEWSDEQSKRLDALRDVQARNALSPAQREELESLLDAQEEFAMSVTAARREAELEAKRDELERTRRAAVELERVRDAQRRLLDEAQTYLVQLRARREALAEEALAVLRRTGPES